jgi:hypothetical protein
MSVAVTGRDRCLAHIEDIGEGSGTAFAAGSRNTAGTLAFVDPSIPLVIAEHGWRVVRRVGGRQIEFYNDASQRPEL